MGSARAVAVAATGERIRPSADARHLFNQMVLRAEPTTLHISIRDTIALGAERRRQGDQKLITELLVEEWIDLADDGGWLLH